MTYMIATEIYPLLCHLSNVSVRVEVIKTFHRSTMTDERLTNLAIFSIEGETAKTLDMTGLIKTFATLKARKSHFNTLEFSKC